MHNFERPLVVAISAVISNNKILLIKRVKDGFEGLWSLPGGKVTAEEHVSEAAIRELLEETGIQATLEDHLGFVSEHQKYADSIKHVALHVFKLTPHSTDVTISDAGELGWFDLDTLSTLKEQVIPSDYLMIEKMVKNREKQYYDCVIDMTGEIYSLIKFQ